MLAVLLLVLVASNSFGLSEPGDIYRNTFLFNTFVWMQVFNAVNARSIRARRSPFEGMTKSSSFLTIIGIIVAAQVLIVTFGSEVFSVEPQSLADWGKAIMIGSSVLLVGAGVRAIGRTVDVSAPARVT